MKKPTRRGISREQSLEAVPVVNPSVRAVKSSAGLITLEIPRREDRLGRILITVCRVSPDVTKKIKLDDIGTFVWEMCDGKATIRVMIERLREQYRLEWKEAEVALVAFMRQLMRKRLVALLVEQKKPVTATRARKSRK
jgi:hypothetical protein